MQSSSQSILTKYDEPVRWDVALSNGSRYLLDEEEYDKLINSQSQIFVLKSGEFLNKAHVVSSVKIKPPDRPEYSVDYQFDEVTKKYKAVKKKIDWDAINEEISRKRARSAMKEVEQS